ncbi:MAG: glycine cleavage T C-terminal barrel domain-containing protein, partial [Alphaproteobacteria bacterium]|nr:glycine cleavage T C-terminal barrel domain-containing protein [Alphaproteobacteria bacterium]
AAGEPHRIIPYGTEAMGALRIEKGHVTAAEVNGQTTAEDLGMARMLSTKKDYVGRWTRDRAGLTDPARQTLVGLVAEDGVSAIRIGSQLIAEPMVTSRPEQRVPMLGHVTSTTYSPALGKPIALALLSGGLQHEGALLYAAYPLRNEQTAVRVVSPHFFDPDGERLRG